MPTDSSTTSPGLLVSVRDAAEAVQALAGGADVIDVKEPRRGALGPASPETWSEVVATVGGRRPVSVALGELLWDDVEDRAAEAVGVQFAKIGLHDCQGTDWVARWQAAWSALPRGVERVAVAYADWKAAKAPRPDEVVAAAGPAGCRWLLVDTYFKSMGDLLTWLPPADLAAFVERAQQAGLAVVLGGSLSASTIPQILPLGPRWIAVRGAACPGGRLTSVSADSIRELRRLL